MTYKVHCPFHADDTASLALYPDHYFCFGCGARGDLDKLDMEIPKTVFDAFSRSTTRKKKEDLPASLDKIRALPRKMIRGHYLPFDSQAFYIVFPDNSFYVKRMWESATVGGKFRSPYGIRKPLYWAKRKGFKTLYVVEGQLNAMSLAKTEVRGDIASPGPCTDLNRPEYVDQYLQYSTIHVIVDKDAPGVVAGLQLKEALIARGKVATLTPLEKDINLLDEHSLDETEFTETISTLIPKD